MKTPRSTFIFLTALAVSGSLLAPAQAEEKKATKHSESASWNFDSIGDWFQEMGEGFADTFSGPKRTAAPFKWTGKVAAGKTFEVRGINGPIRATATSGSEVELVAIRSGRRNDPESVKIEVIPHAEGVTVCAVYPSKDVSRPNECKPGGGGRMNVRNNDVNVEFELRIPRDVNFEGRTVNGGIEADIEGRAALSTVNGRIQVIAGTLTEATTVNGSIRAEVKSIVNSAEDIKLSTVNGSVHLDLPEGVNADVSAKTVNGGITSDFTEIEVRKKWGPRSAEGRLGHGGRELELATVNGGIRITKGN
ncbi:MAG TPA: hypothetical protein PKU70_07580 [Vicinamibacteria bacterium]|nr:hypothetical protein [Vicinamibacteria bacterium]